MRYFALSLIALALFSGCSTKKKRPKTADAASAALATALKKGDGQAIYDLLDQKSKWSLMSALRAQREIRKLVKKHYPKDRQPRLLARTRGAAKSADATKYFLFVVKRDRLFATLGSADSAAKARARSTDRADFAAGGKLRRFCHADGVWTFCGFRARFEALKVRANRDLTTVRENAETFRKGG